MSRRNHTLDDDGLPFLPVWISKWDSRTAHLSFEEEGAYWRLIKLCWKTPGCSVPADPAWLARMLRVDEVQFRDVVAPILAEFFTLSGAGTNARYNSKKLSEVYAHRMAAHERRKGAGKLGGQAKALKNKQTDGSNGVACQSQSQSQSQSHNHIASKLASARDQILSVCGPAMAPNEHPWGVDAFLKIWEAETDRIDLIADVVKRFTAQPREKPIRKLRALNGEVEATLIEAQNSAQAAANRPPPKPIETPAGKAGDALAAIVAKQGQPWAASWLQGCEWNGAELYAPTELQHARIELAVGRILQDHGYSVALKPSG
jgi:uncharacterized protein YdaU (DUF1376 family)